MYISIYCTYILCMFCYSITKCLLYLQSELEDCYVWFPSKVLPSVELWSNTVPIHGSQ